MATAAITKRYTPEECLALERKAPFKSEYCNGYIIAMSGASRAHNLISGNVYSKVSNHLQDSPCEAYITNMRVQAYLTGLYTYPDVVVVCDEPRFLDDHSDTLLNPTLIVEVLSPSTEDYDRVGKFAHYKTLVSLKEYVLVSQDEVLVEHFVKRGDDWVRSEIRDISGRLVLDSIGCAVPLRQIYQKVKLAGRMGADG